MISFGSVFNTGGSIYPKNMGLSSNNSKPNIKQPVEKYKSFSDLWNKIPNEKRVKMNGSAVKPLELSCEDEKFISRLNMSKYGFHKDSDRFWFHTTLKKAGALNQNMTGDGKIKEGLSRHDFINNLIDNKTRAFQIAGTDKYGENKLITVYTCDSKGCRPEVTESNISAQNSKSTMHDFASKLLGDIEEVQGASVWKG